jgi:hypothetical protein
MKSLFERLKTIKKVVENKEASIKKFNEGGKPLADIKCAFNANILINNSGVLYNTPITSEYFFIPIENIKKIEVKSDEELSKQIKDKKIPIVGDISFPKQTHFFLIINYTESDLEVEKTIESKMAVDGANAILKARKQYIKDHPEVFLEDLDYSLEAKTPKQDFKPVDIPEQINKLFELLEKGALSIEEFNEKKKELLSKM